jgi:DNA mismatch endonuclease, patch repair protein
MFVHGCFWHSHEGCPKARVPKANRVRWETKLADNRVRDERKQRQLEERGFRVLVVWECQLCDREHLGEVVRSFVASGGAKGNE